MQGIPVTFHTNLDGLWSFPKSVVCVPNLGDWVAVKNSGDRKILKVCNVTHDYNSYEDKPELNIELSRLH